jgi:hypothetical protein
VTDTPFLYSIVAVSMSLASLAGLVIAFRRTGVWHAHDVFRLRQIAEWGFANVLLALLAIPAAAALGSDTSALRFVGVVALLYVVVNLLVLARRTRRMTTLRAVIPITPVVVAIDIALVMLATATAILASITPWQLTLLLLVLRPMLAFTFVLASIGREEDAS